MENETLGKYTRSFGIALIVTCIFSALLVIVKESSPDTVLALMKSLGHHWVIHGIVNLILFFGLGFVLAGLGGGKGVRIAPKTLTGGLVAVVLVCAAVIAAFYLIGD